MKNFPICNSERNQIITMVADWKQWQGTRYGFAIHIVRVPVASGNRQILYSVSRDGHTQGAPVHTVTEAIIEINDIIEAGRKAFLQRTAANNAPPDCSQISLFDIGASIAQGIYQKEAS